MLRLLLEENLPGSVAGALPKVGFDAVSVSALLAAGARRLVLSTLVVATGCSTSPEGHEISAADSPANAAAQVTSFRARLRTALHGEPLHGRAVVASGDSVDVGCAWPTAFLACRVWQESGVVPGAAVLQPAADDYGRHRPNGDSSRVALCNEIERLGLTAEFLAELSAIVREPSEQPPVRVQALHALRNSSDPEVDRLLFDMLDDAVVGYVAMTLLSRRQWTDQGVARLRLAISQHGSRRGLWVQSSRSRAWIREDIEGIAQCLKGSLRAEALTVLAGVDGNVEAQVYDVLAETLRDEPAILSSVLVLAIVDRVSVPWLVPVVARAVHSECATTRELALQASSRVLGAEGVESLREIIRSNGPMPDACAAALGLGEVVTDVAVWNEVLQTAIARDDPRQKRAVLIAMQRSGLRDSGLARLVGHLIADPDRSVADLARAVRFCIRE
ncbi:MAG: hypothetical protein IPK26_17770 [Planctomycetes bacterium]|nr:hypothetical protein [Planctomycetota bacterium]